MGKVKLNLPTGVVEEKSLITSFEEKGNKYVILDADSVGSMGLPIILVCKIDNDRVVKITDANEWTEVKGYLKDIISGTSKNYITIGDSLSADEGYFTQLTLPVASFETIKGAYAPAEPVAAESAAETAPEAPAVEEPVVETPSVDAPEANPLISEETPAVEANPIVDAPAEPAAETAPEAPTVEEPVAEPAVETPEAPAIDLPEAPALEEPAVEPTVEEAAPEAPAVDMPLPETPALEVETPVEEPAPEAPAVVEEVPVMEEPAPPVEAPIVEEAPAVEEPAIEAPAAVESVVEQVAQSAGSKDAFMKACSDLYDAFVMTIKENK